MKSLGKKCSVIPKRHEQSIPTLEGDEVVNQRKFEGKVTVAERVSNGFYRVGLDIVTEAGQIPQAYFLPVTTLLWPREGMRVSYLAQYANSLSRDELTIDGVRLDD